MKTFTSIKNYLILQAVLMTALLLASSPLQAQNSSRQAKTTAINAVLEDFYKPEQPGAAVLVVHKGKVLLRKGYGLANLEQQIPITPDILFGIGSNTKQFTAVAILKLEEEGKLNVHDNINQYLPDFPTQGEKITIEHLLTHTSGIKSYSAVLEWTNTWQKDMTYTELIALFKGLPLDFKPGERYKYSNSGYLLLAAIIEKVTGMTYPAYLQEHVIKKAGMKNSLYGYPATSAKVAVGYTKTKDGYQQPVPMTINHMNGGGGIFATVDDMIRWWNALEGGKLISKENVARAQTPFVLNNGEKIPYGYGFELSSWGNKPTIEHGGRMLGYLAQTMNFPEEEVQVIVLTNEDSRLPDVVAVKVAAIAMEQPINAHIVQLDEKTMDEYVGVYQINQQSERMIIREGNKLYSKRTGMPKIELQAIGNDEFYLYESLTTLRFERDATGAVNGMTLKTREGHVARAPKTDKPLPKEKVAITLADDVLKQYTGQYELAPNFILSVRLEGNQLLAQGTGQPAFEIYPETETKFFVKVMEAELEFTKKEHKVTGLVYSQRGRSVAAKKID